MVSQKYYTSALVTLDVLQDAVDQSNVFGWLMHRFKEHVGENGYALLTHPVLRVRKPEITDWCLRPDTVRVDVFARVVPLQRL